MPGVPDFKQRNSLVGFPGRQNLPVRDNVGRFADRPPVIIAQKLQIRIEVSARIARFRIAEDSNAGEADGFQGNRGGIRSRLQRIQERVRDGLQRRRSFDDRIREAGEPDGFELIRFGRS